MVGSKIEKLIRKINELGYHSTPGEILTISVVIEDYLKEVNKKNVELEKRIEQLEKATPKKREEILEELESVDDAEEMEEL